MQGYDKSGGTFYLKDNSTSGPADRTFRYGPRNNNWLPVAGDWNPAPYSLPVDWENHLVVFKDRSIPANAKNAVEAAGGEVVSQIPEICVLVATGGPYFPSSLWNKLPGMIVSIGENFLVQGSAQSLKPKLFYGEETISIEDIDLYNANNLEDNDLYVAHQWDIKRVGGTAETWAVEKGKNITVAVLDTGVFAKHPDIALNYMYGKDYKDITLALPPGYSMWDQGGPQDYDGHGTHVAGAIAASITAGRIIGVAPEAGIANYKVMMASITDANVSTSIGNASWTLQAIVDAAGDGCQVINTGKSAWQLMEKRNENRPGAAYLALIRATHYAWEKGSLVVIPSGNNAENLAAAREHFDGPEGLPRAITVNSTGPAEVLAAYSNFGGYGSPISAPGGDISNPAHSYCLSAYSPLNSWAPGAGWVWSVGTSNASAKVSGVAALYFAHLPGYGPREVQARLFDTAENIGSFNVFGHGLVNAKLD